MRKTIIIALSLIIAFGCSSVKEDDIDKKISTLMKEMTLEEKIGQLNQYTGVWTATGPVTTEGDLPDQIRAGGVGSMLNVLGTSRTRAYQEMAMKSRLKIPMLFGQDVVHGYKTTFPIPLAEAASWDLKAIKKAARVAAVEASASGIHWTFAPMVDIGRDPRWGRVMEGAGEDPYLGSLIAAARVKGFQGESLSDVNTVMACAKHFAAYGAAEGGRDYNSVDMSERMLWEIYLPPFKAAVDADVSTLMNSFNDLNGIPATGNVYLQREILKGKWDFKGFVVSDWGSTGEMIAHGYSKDGKEAAKQAITAGSDMDMESRCFRDNLAALVKEDPKILTLIDDAVRRVLRKKYEVGLFDDPYKYCDAQREEKEMNNPEHTKITREVAAKSIVLLKNEGNILPLSNDVKKVAFIGPLVKDFKQNQGFWSVDIPDLDYEKFIVSQWDGVKNRLGNKGQLLYAKGCEIEGEDKSGFAEAVRVAKESDVVILSIGESRDMSGEAKSRSNISLPGVQEELVKVIQATGKPIVVLINAGRPLVFNWTADNVPAILYTWWLGSQAGNAIADVLWGDVNPAGKLPMTFPREVGQVPIYYSYFNTGRPSVGDDKFYKSAYIDLPTTPKFAFGYGLSYTTFEYKNLKLSKSLMTENENIVVSLDVINTGKFAGEEVVQLYLRDKVGSVVRPVKELKGFEKVMLAVGETKNVTFIINKETLSFFNDKLEFKPEAGEFKLMIGSSSDKILLEQDFELVK